MLAPVIVGVDGSAESLAAAEWAVREAERRGRRLRLVHAWERGPRPVGESSTGAVQRHLARRVLRQAEDRVRAASPGTRVDDEQARGPATEVLLLAAAQADLLVLGSRGLSGFTGFLVGSVALGVIAEAECPVVLVRAGEVAADEHLPAADGSASTRTGCRDVVVGVDVADPSEETIEFAFGEARLRGARLRAVYAGQPGGPRGPQHHGSTPAAPRALLDDLLRPWREKYPDVEVLATAATGRARSVLVRAASGASLLVVGHRLADRPVGPRTGSVTHAAVHHVDCPVAVVPHH
ncbi:universal stress protein [Streptomyces sp. 351MFTsu5.1]|uniref:universal stress protein n=1 Tax=Streptomyces sp. 351MFTsu5.1 TaxID=1172180 RepID=UPI00048CDEAE|nr:universal stress protein [Streptomyces sp. 351MFTsu5.1]